MMKSSMTALSSLKNSLSLYDLTPQLTLGLNFCTLSGTNMTEFTLAYAEYLERMFDESHELVTVDVFSVPQDVDPTSPAVQEWAHFV
jgi:hypothetical protein